MKLIMTRGLPASGKTTWAKEQVEAGNGRVKRVNKDDLREMIDNRKYSQDREAKILLARDALVKVFLGQNCDVIVDDTGFNEKHEQQLRKIAVAYGADFEIKDFYLPVGECIDRDAQRAKPVGRKVIRDMWLRYVCAPAPKKSVSLPSIIVCDIDGTLAHMDGRSPYDYKAVDTDKPDEDVINILRDTQAADRVIVFSGRTDNCRKATEKWLDDNSVWWSELFMRKTGDVRPDYIVKRELYEKHIKDKYNVLFVLDDRDQVVDQWRELGLKCFQVASGTF